LSALDHLISNAHLAKTGCERPPRVLNHAPRTVAGKHYNDAKLFEGMRTALEA
jgi:hypothetical protein